MFNEIRLGIVLTDLALSHLTGLAFLSYVKKEAPKTLVIIVSGAGTLDDAIKALHMEAWDYNIIKPIHDTALLGYTVSRAMERVALKEENKRYQDYLEAEVEKSTTEQPQV